MPPSRSWLEALLLHLLLGSSAADRSASPQLRDRMDMVEAYLCKFGIRRLPMLSVRFGDSEVHGEESQFVRNEAPFLKNPPSIVWDVSLARRAALLFIDIDCGGRPMNNSESGVRGPLLHSLWEECGEGGLSGCTTVKKWLPPGNGRPISNRYTFVLFRQEAKLHRPVSNVINLGEFLHQNPGLKPVAWNFMLVGGRNPTHSGRGRRERKAKTPIAKP
ncbi:hypothetical protein AB1Y20_008068 [Prymnesium parvum]|uniref:Uncharacterized protein n=1 Tax=Prymnesium parvum TaxID=97485 RepID=A0AB34IVM3_PRYPA